MNRGLFEGSWKTAPTAGSQILFLIKLTVFPNHFMSLVFLTFN